MTALKLATIALLLSTVACSKPEPQPIPEPPPPAPIPEPQPPIPPEPVPEPTACKATENRSLVRARKVSPRIVGGHESMPGAYPWMVGIGYNNGQGSVFHYCGGTLIASNWVLTAAHCQVLPGDVVTIGRHILSDPGGVQVKVKRALSHAEYDPGTNRNDISVLELEQHLISPHPVTLGDAPQSGTVRAIGWGLTTEGGIPSSTLQEVDVPIVSNAQCANIYSTDMTQICAGEAGKDSCAGDSGGPLLFEGMQAGVTSYGLGCARPGLPGVYTRVSAFEDWIEACIVED